MHLFRLYNVLNYNYCIKIYYLQIYMKQLLYICLMLAIIISFAYFNTLQHVEQFTPKIREFYRPIMRNTRILGEGFYDKTSSNISNLFRKFGIL